MKTVRHIDDKAFPFGIEFREGEFSGAVERLQRAGYTIRVNYAFSTIGFKTEPARDEAYQMLEQPDTSGPDSKLVNAHAIATQAASLVDGDRSANHGDVVENHRNIARLWNGYLANMSAKNNVPIYTLTPLDVANMMELLKIARRCAGKHNIDDYIDGAGYAAVAGEIAERSPDVIRHRRPQSDTAPQYPDIAPGTYGSGATQPQPSDDTDDETSSFE